MIVTTSCGDCLQTITVPLVLFERRVIAFCPDAGRACATRRPGRRRQNLSMRGSGTTSLGTEVRRSVVAYRPGNRVLR